MVVVVMDKDGICRYSSLPLLVIKRYGLYREGGGIIAHSPRVSFRRSEGKIRFKVLSSRMRTGIGYKIIINRFSFVFLSIDKLVTFGSFG